MILTLITARENKSRGRLVLARFPVCLPPGKGKISFVVRKIIPRGIAGFAAADGRRSSAGSIKDIDHAPSVGAPLELQNDPISLAVFFDSPGAEHCFPRVGHSWLALIISVMPSLGFKIRFAARVAGGSKSHTIRAWRKRPFKAGDNLAFFSGMRTKQCRRLRPDAHCVTVRAIEIESVRRRVILEGVRLKPRAVEALARKDGFANANEFWAFFNETHGRFLRGQLIEWRP